MGFTSAQIPDTQESVIRENWDNSILMRRPKFDGVTSIRPILATVDHPNPESRLNPADSTRDSLDHSFKPQSDSDSETETDSLDLSATLWNLTEIIKHV